MDLFSANGLIKVRLGMCAKETAFKMNHSGFIDTCSKYLKPKYDRNTEIVIIGFKLIDVIRARPKWTPFTGEYLLSVYEI